MEAELKIVLTVLVSFLAGGFAGYKLHEIFQSAERNVNFILFPSNKYWTVIYKKAGSLWGDSITVEADTKEMALENALDLLNEKYGKGSISISAVRELKLEEDGE